DTPERHARRNEAVPRAVELLDQVAPRRCARLHACRGGTLEARHVDQRGVRSADAQVEILLRPWADVAERKSAARREDRLDVAGEAHRGKGRGGGRRAPPGNTGTRDTPLQESAAAIGLALLAASHVEHPITALRAT